MSNNAVAKAKVKMIKKNPCPFCDRAEALLKRKGAHVEILDLTDQPDEIMRWKQETGWATVPMIFINQNFIGGYNDMKALDEEGKLDELLAEEN